MQMQREIKMDKRLFLNLNKKLFVKLGNNNLNLDLKKRSLQRYRIHKFMQNLM